jgi:hypothetical protein
MIYMRLIINIADVTNNFLSDMEIKDMLMWDCQQDFGTPD